MELTVSGKHFEITDPIRDYASEKSSRLTRFYDRITGIEVIADRDGDHSHEVEIIVSVEHHDPFIARTAHEDLYACIDDAIAKMERQLRDHKEKLRNRKHNVS